MKDVSQPIMSHKEEIAHPMLERQGLPQSRLVNTHTQDIIGLVCHQTVEGNLDGLFETLEPFVCGEASIEYDRTPGHTGHASDHVSYDFIGGMLMKMEDESGLFSPWKGQK